MLGAATLFLLCRCGQDAAHTLCPKGSLKSTLRSVTVTNFPDCLTEKKQTTKKKAESKKAEQKVFSLYKIYEQI